MAKISDVIEGLQILLKYCNPNSQDIAAEHDVIMAGPDDCAEISEEDRVKLEALGWHEGEFGWARFV
jgi:hypothetical protein